MKNAFGPETKALAMPGYVEYLSNTGYVVNGADNCTSLSATATVNSNPAGIVSGGAIDDISLGGGTSDLSYKTPLNKGMANFVFTKPGSGHNGTIDLDVDLTAFPWLKYNWDGSADGTLENHPEASATFGQYRGHDRIIYWRETDE